MKRLIDGACSGDAAELQLAALVRSVRPFRANPFRKRKVLLQMSRATSAPNPRYRKPALSAVVLAVLGSAGIAGASYGWLRGGTVAPSEVAAPAAAPKLSTVPRRASTTPPEVVAPEVVAPEVASADVASAPVSPAKPTENAAPRRSERTLGNKPRLKEEGEDPSEVLEAIRALRKQGDAARAQVLLDQYLKTHPAGALSEDALVLSIEAALARHDPRAADYARRYLKSFPKGRFRALAERVLASRP